MADPPAEADNAPPKYVNYMKLAHTQVEFFLDLITLYPPINEEPMDPGKAHGVVAGRFAINPIHAKQLMQILVENVRQYEAKHGEIAAPQTPASVTLN